MNLLSRLIALGTFLGLAACGTFSAESFLGDEIQGNSFNAHLAREYQDRATSEAYVDSNWVDTAIFARKGRSAASGANVMPTDPASVGVLPADRLELDAARSQLLAALDRGGREGSRVAACAKAQRHYDGWVEQASDNKLGAGGTYFGGAGGPVQPDRVEAERAAFMEALADCSGIAMPRGLTIYFGFDRYNLTAEAREVVTEIAKSAGSRALTVIGHTDTSGPVSYNQALGQRRADAVAAELRAQGAQVKGTVSRGQSDLAVQTGDGVREPLNRRAVIQMD